MLIADLIMKTLGIIQIAVGTILILHGQKVFATDPRLSKYWFFASLVLYLAGSLFILVPSRTEDRRRTE